MKKLGADHVMAMFGEFGRMLCISAYAGRDHCDKVFSVMPAGGGLELGVVVGSSTRAGDVPMDRSIRFNDVLATKCSALKGLAEESYFLRKVVLPNSVSL